MKRLCVTILLLISGAAQAQPADDVLEAALSGWRAASWYARIGDPNVAALELEEFREKWGGVVTLPDAPGLHKGDARWRDVLRDVAQLADNAAVALERNEVPAARSALTRIGDTLAASRIRTATSGFPEAQRRYRDAIEKLIGFMAASERYGMGAMDRALHEQLRPVARDASAAAAEMASLSPARWANDVRFQGLLKQNVDGARNLSAALERSQPLALGLEANGLIGVARANYNLLFLGYGY